MNAKRIVCADHNMGGACPYCGAIENVGTNTSGGPTATDNEHVITVVRNLRQGVEYYTYGEESRKKALVHAYHCNSCRRDFIRSAPDAVKDNNLDSLRACRWG